MSINSTQREIAHEGITTVLDYWWSRRNMDLHTQIPAKVVSVNYIENSVTVQPLIKTALNATQDLTYPQVSVPMSLLSTGVGGIKITFPVKVGCVGLLKFSERDPTNWITSAGNKVVSPKLKDNLSMGARMYPISFEVGLFTPSSAIVWDDTDIVIENPTGNVVVNGVTINATDPTNILITNLTGNLVVNGLTLVAGGTDVILANGDSLAQLRIDLELLKAAYTIHVHGGVTIGSGVTSTPS